MSHAARPLLGADVPAEPPPPLSPEEQREAEARAALRAAAQKARRFAEVAHRLADLSEMEIRNGDGEAHYVEQLRHDHHLLLIATSDLMDYVPGLAWLGDVPSEETDPR